MSTETKIGLIIGLGFIVCFAVLLANSDPEQKSAIQWTHVVDGVGTNRVESHPKVVQAQRDSASNAARARAAQPRNAPPSSEHAPTRFDRPSNPQLRPFVPAVTGNLQQAAPSSSQRTDSMVDGAVQASPTRDATEAALLVESQAKTRLRDYLNARQNPQSEPGTVAEPTSHVATKDKTSRTQHAARSSRNPTRIHTPVRRDSRSPQRYVVVAGDTLTRIAGKFYGSRSRKVIDAVFDANRAILPDADHLRPGMKITLPIVEGFASSVAKPVGAGSIPPVDRAKTSNPQPTIKKTPPTWYQIKKDDRYVSIARTQLGDASRWNEIHELNKDRFPDPGRIQWGVRIRLPAVGLVSAGNR